MSKKIEIVIKKWIVMAYEHNHIPYEKAIRITAISELEIQFGNQTTWIRLYANNKESSFQLWYEKNENAQFKKDAKLLKQLIYK